MSPILIGVIALAVIILLSMAIKIVTEYERGVIFRLGRLVGAKGPGLFFIIPFVDKMVKVDLRVVTMDVPSQEVITKDNVTVRVNAVVYFTSQISQTTLRNVLGQSEMDELLAERERLNQSLQKIIDEHTDPWGVKVSTVEIKEVELPEQMRRMMAAQAEAERERRAKIIHADGEFQASERLAQAGTIMAREPTTLQLRYLQTLTEIASEKNSTIIFPLPIEFLKALTRIGIAPETESEGKTK